jgi:hypothetical protein
MYERILKLAGIYAKFAREFTKVELSPEILSVISNVIDEGIEAWAEFPQELKDQAVVNEEERPFYKKVFDIQGQPVNIVLTAGSGGRAFFDGEIVQISISSDIPSPEAFEKRVGELLVHELTHLVQDQIYSGEMDDRTALYVLVNNFIDAVNDGTSRQEAWKESLNLFDDETARNFLSYTEAFMTLPLNELEWMGTKNYQETPDEREAYVNQFDYTLDGKLMSYMHSIYQSSNKSEQAVRDGVEVLMMNRGMNMTREDSDIIADKVLRVLQMI